MPDLTQKELERFDWKRLKEVMPQVKELCHLLDVMKENAGLNNQKGRVAKADFQRKCVYYMPAIARKLLEQDAEIRWIIENVKAGKTLKYKRACSDGMKELKPSEIIVDDQLMEFVKETS